MPHDDSDDKVDVAEGLLADSQEAAADEAANASLRDRLLRALAEVENTRRRAERRVADAREYGISDFAVELLNIGTIETFTSLDPQKVNSCERL
jgi:molecular chaperone GrpE